jgi:hypothetical protein
MVVRQIIWTDCQPARQDECTLLGRTSVAPTTVGFEKVASCSMTSIFVFGSHEATISNWK